MAMNQPMCRKCGKLIRFLTTKKGKQMPVDSFSVQVVPRETGALFFLPDGSTVRGVETPQAGPKTVTAYRSHFVTCPFAEQLRKPQEGKRDAERQKIRERIEKERAEEARRAEKRAEKQRKEAEQRQAEDAQLSLFRRAE